MGTKEAEEKKAYMREYMREYRKKHKNKNKRVSVTLSKHEYMRLEINAITHKIRPTARLKELAFIALDEQDNYPLDVSASLSELTHVLRGVGNNVNQIARHSNTFKQLVDQNEILQHLHSLEKEIKAFIAQNSKKKTHDY